VHQQATVFTTHICLEVQNAVTHDDSKRRGRRIMRHFGILLLPALAATLAPAQSQAQIEQRYTRIYNECVDASGGVTADMMDCSAAEIDRQDARLNQAYVMVMRPLPQPKKRVLRNLQRSWIVQRDARCHTAIRGNDGTAANLIYSGCILDETIRRTIFLENYKG
jgi:uncharacterized protein YecT (DUF1311 family)